MEDSKLNPQNNVDLHSLVKKLENALANINKKDVEEKNFDSEEKEIIYRLIRFVRFLDSLGIFGSALLKIVLWGTAMWGAILTYQNYFSAGIR